MNKLLLLTLSVFLLSACVTGPETNDPSDVNADDQTLDQVVPAEVEDEYDINLDNALIELDIVEEVSE